MKREDVKQKIPGITDEQLQWLMDENGADVTREKKRAGDLQAELDTAKGQLKTAQDGLAAFDGVDVADLKSQIEKLKGDLAAQADGYAFDAALDGAIRDARGRSVKAIRGMLDVDALKASKNRTADIQAALDELAKSSAWAFAPESIPPAASGVTVSTGSEHGAGRREAESRPAKPCAVRAGHRRPAGQRPGKRQRLWAQRGGQGDVGGEERNLRRFE